MGKIWGACVPCGLCPPAGPNTEPPLISKSEGFTDSLYIIGLMKKWVLNGSQKIIRLWNFPQNKKKLDAKTAKYCNVNSAICGEDLMSATKPFVHNGNIFLKIYKFGGI